MQFSAKDNKKLIRKEIAARLESMPAESRAAKSLAIEEQLLLMEEFRRSKTVLLYASFGYEAETRNLIVHCLSQGMHVGLPKVIKTEDRLRIFTVKYIGELRPGCWGIPEPVESAEREMKLEDIDLVVVPGVAFDESCNRLGRGKGYYDKLLGSIPRGRNAESPEIKPFLAGLAFEEQLVPSLYCGPYDIKMDAVITDKRMILRHGS
jgi:5-formyltetrahydrofolate cyclo-ligase